MTELFENEHNVLFLIPVSAIILKIQKQYLIS
jgi:hypothetical protein